MSILNQLMQELEVARKAHSDPNVHGPAGLFGVEGGSRDVISSRVQARGLVAELPVVGTVDKYPLYPYVTGKAAASGAQVAGSCNNAPTAGNLLSSYQTAQFGTTQFATRELDVTTVGAKLNRGEAVDLRFVNDPLALQMGKMWMNVSGQDALRYGREVLMRMVEVGMEFQQYIGTKTYTGTGAGVEFVGLEGIVKVNHLDAITGVANPALDSDVRDFNEVDITTSAGSQAIVAAILDMYRNLKNNASGMGFGETQFAVVMKPQMFTDVTDVWPCQMSTFRCLPTTANANVSYNVSTDNSLKLAQEMRAGRFLWIDGDKVRVILDDFIPEGPLDTPVAGTTKSDIYILPLTIRGGRPVLFYEYFDYSQGMSQAILDGKLGQFMYIDRGIYAVVARPVSNWCMQWQVKNELRLRLETPMLAGRIFDVAHTVTTVYRSGNEAGPGYVSGGSAGQTAPTYHQP